MKAVLLTAASLFLVVATGCNASKCETVCANYNACSVSERSADFDCNQMCNDISETQARQKQAGANDCASEYNEYLSCWESNSKSICDSTFTGCNETATAFKTCMNAYCKSVLDAGETDPSCNSKGQTFFVTY